MPGADDLEGGAGADLSDFTAFTDSTPGAMDVIMDFQQGLDRIRLSVTDTSDAPGWQGSLFVGMAGFAGGGVASVRYEAAGEDTLVLADARDGGDAELAFRMVGSFTLTAADFPARWRGAVAGQPRATKPPPAAGTSGSPRHSPRS